VKPSATQVSNAAREPHVRRLSLFATLSPEDVSELQARFGRAEAHKAGWTLGAAETRPFFLVSGWACLAHGLSDGRRQILAFLLPGDGVGFDLLSRSRKSVEVIALTEIKLRQALPGAFVPGPRLARALAGAAAAQQGRLIDHVVRLGRQTAYERMAHLLLEFHDRLLDIAEASETGFEMPLKQEVLADALGLSLVHINRILQQLRRDGLVITRGKKMTLLNRAALMLAADQNA
jgi:CRP-like cAMP-binding protein